MKKSPNLIKNKHEMSQEQNDSECTTSQKSDETRQQDNVEKKKYQWTDEEDGKFIEAVFLFNKSYNEMARYMKTKTAE